MFLCRLCLKLSQSALPRGVVLVVKMCPHPAEAMPRNCQDTKGALSGLIFTSIHCRPCQALQKATEEPIKSFTDQQLLIK